MMDFLDDWVFGPLNWVDKFFGAFQILLRNPHARNKQKYSRFNTVQMVVPRKDKNQKNPGFHVVIQHLNKYGVDTYFYSHDSQNLYFRVRKNQETWARKLWNGERMWTPSRSWKDGK